MKVDKINNLFNAPSLSLTEEELHCPIGLEKMQHAATLICGHTFERAMLEHHYRTDPSHLCPLCRRTIQVLPKDEEIQKLIDLALKRRAIQTACDEYFLNHPNEKNVKPPAHKGLESTNPLSPLKAEPNFVEILLDVRKASDRISVITPKEAKRQWRNPFGYHSQQPGLHWVRVSTNPFLPTTIRLKKESLKTFTLLGLIGISFAVGLLSHMAISKR